MSEDIFAVVQFLIFFALFIGISVSFGVAKSKMRKEKQKNVKGQNNRRQEDVPIADEDLDNLDDMLQDEVVELKKEKVVPLKKKDNRQVKTSRGKLFEKHNFSRKDVVSVDDTNSQVVTEKFKKEARQDTAHTHPTAISSKNEKIVVEKVPDASGSLGNVSDEGCAEHGNLRYVLKEIEKNDTSSDKNIVELRRAVVWSEILGKPKCKRY